jgi:hypothetical protein
MWIVETLAGPRKFTALPLSLKGTSSNFEVRVPMGQDVVGMSSPPPFFF